MKILYLKTEDPAISHLCYFDPIAEKPIHNDFLHDTLLIGLRNNFGFDVIDYPGAWYMYTEERKKRKDFTTEKFWGKLFTLYDSLENFNLINREDIKNKIKKNFFDLIIYGSIRGENLFLEEAINSKSKIISLFKVFVIYIKNFSISHITNCVCTNLKSIFKTFFGYFL